MSLRQRSKSRDDDVDALVIELKEISLRDHDDMEASKKVKMGPKSNAFMGHVYTHLPSQLPAKCPETLTYYRYFNFSSFSLRCHLDMVRMTEGWSPHRHITLTLKQWLDVAPFFVEEADKSSDRETILASVSFCQTNLCK